MDGWRRSEPSIALRLQPEEETIEAAAHLTLIEKAALADSYHRLNEQAQALRDDLARLDEMRLQLADRAAELEAVLAWNEIATFGVTTPN